MLQRARALLDQDPRAAGALARDVLRDMPDMPAARLIEAQALRRAGDPAAAAAALARLAQRHPQAAPVLWEWGCAAAEAGDPANAVTALERLARIAPRPELWFLLARQLRALGRDNDAWRADRAGVQSATLDDTLVQAALAMKEARFAEGEGLLNQRLAADADDPVALRLLGETRWRQGDMSEALALVARAVAAAPGFDLARDFLVRLLMQADRLPEALAHAEMLATSPFRTPGHDLLLASVLVGLGEQARARDIYQRLLGDRADQPQLWQNLGHVLKTLGEQGAAVDAYRQAVTRQPTMGEAWWSLANLKTVKLSGEDVATMERALATLGDAKEAREDVLHLHFSLGKAWEDVGDHARAFAHYDQGNRLRRALVPWDPTGFSAEVAEETEAFGAAYLASVPPGGCPAPDPIFVVGLPRAGSTLVEHILASHSQIEGTMELPTMMMIAGRLRARIDAGEFPDLATLLAALTPADRTRLGEEYIERTRIHRREGTPFFIDKMPNNWQHVGLIRLILPNARIVDARRHPIANGFSAWKQHFARGQAFAYDLGEVGLYYRDYLARMAAHDAAVPGAVHRVIYERMVADTRGEVTRLLAYLGLPFEEACLAFHETKRAVRTASSEQVRTPIFTDAVAHWRTFEPYLGRLIAALGDAPDRYAAG